MSIGVLTNPKTSTGDLLKAIDMYWKAIGTYPKTPAVVQEFYDVGELSSEELKEKLHEMSGKIRSQIEMSNGDLKRITSFIVAMSRG